MAQEGVGPNASGAGRGMGSGDGGVKLERLPKCRLQAGPSRHAARHPNDLPQMQCGQGRLYFALPVASR